MPITKTIKKIFFYINDLQINDLLQATLDFSRTSQFSKDSKEDEERKKQKEKKRIDNNNFGKRKRTKRNRQKGMQKKITSMLKENGETTNEREEIISICSDFYRKL